MIRTIERVIGCMSFWIIIGVILTSPFIYWGLLNVLGPSTEYHDPWIEGATLLPSGKYEASIGDRIFVRYTIIRHQINGNCLLKVYRYGEYIGGPMNGERVLIDFARLRFKGQNELRHPRWPVMGLVLGQKHRINGSELPNKPLLPQNATAQELALYAVARYYCNPLDWMFPRYLQGGPVSNETERVNLIVRRSRS